MANALLKNTANTKRSQNRYKRKYRQIPKLLKSVIFLSFIHLSATFFARNDARVREIIFNAKQEGPETLNRPPKLIQPGNHSRIPDPDDRIGPNGEHGYVHDPTFLVKNSPSFRIPEDEAEQLCRPAAEGYERQAGARNAKKIRNHIETSKAIRDVKLFCSIYTYSGNVHFTNAISETWGKKCDGMLYASDQSNTTTGHVHIPSMSKHGFTFESIFQRVRAMMAYVYDNFLDEYDHFHFCGDDVYMMVENMKEFLASEKVRQWDDVPDQYMIAGFWINWDFGLLDNAQFYFGGGSGYTLSRKALKAYVEGPLQYCNIEVDKANEDMVFSQCLWSNFTTNFIDTRDESGAHRYHQANLTAHAHWPDDKTIGQKYWAFMMDKVIPKSLKHMKKNFGFPYVTGDDYISNSSIVFHMHPHPMSLRRMEMLLYKDIQSECKDIK